VTQGQRDRRLRRSQPHPSGPAQPHAGIGLQPQGWKGAQAGWPLFLKEAIRLAQLGDEGRI